MAKVMENLIQQNFGSKIFRQFSTGFTYIPQKAIYTGIFRQLIP